jgi:hypothetical protein
MPPSSGKAPETPSDQPSQDPEPTVSLSATAIMETAVQESLNNPEHILSLSGEINMSRLKSRYWALTAYQWRRANLLGIATIPEIPMSQLEKLDRGSALVKFLARLQVGYLIVQLIAQKVEGLPSTQLEIGALAFASCSAITYLLYWKRPQGV